MEEMLSTSVTKGDVLRIESEETGMSELILVSEMNMAGDNVIVFGQVIEYGELISFFTEGKQVENLYEVFKKVAGGLS